jgi:hypothetical protein
MLIRGQRESKKAGIGGKALKAARMAADENSKKDKLWNRTCAR